MKILEVAGSGGVGKEYMGPVTRVATLLSNALAKLGNEVTVVDAKNTHDRASLNCTDVQLIEIDSPVWPNNSDISSVQKFIAGLSSINLENYDIIHVHDWKIGHLLQKKYNVKCVYTVHTPQNWAGPCADWKTKLGYYIKRSFGIHEYNYIKSCRLAIILGSYLERIFKINNIKVIPNGIDIERWNRYPSAKEILGLNKNQFLLLYIGRVTHSKGLHILIEAMRQIGNINIKLVVIGKMGVDDYSKHIKKLSNGQQISFPGFISNNSEQFLQYLSAADIFIVPSLCDNQPTVVLEALSMSTPVIASNVGGIPDMLNESIGLLFESGNIKQLADKIKYLYENPEIRNNMALKCRQHIQNNYTWEICARKHIEEFRKIL